MQRSIIVVKSDLGHGDDVVPVPLACDSKEPIKRLAPMLSEWVIAKVKEVSRKMGISFTSMEDHVEALFCEIERQCSISPGII